MSFSSTRVHASARISQSYVATSRQGYPQQHYKNQRLHNYMLDIQIYAHLYTMIKSVICIDSCFGRKNKGKT